MGLLLGILGAFALIAYVVPPKARFVTAWTCLLAASAAAVWTAQFHAFWGRLGVFFLTFTVVMKITTYLCGGRNLNPIAYAAFLLLFPAPVVHDFRWDRPDLRRAGRIFALALLELTFGMLVLFAASQHFLRGPFAMMAVLYLAFLGSTSLLAALLVATGFQVTPLFQAPYAATSIREFWSRRWNLAFRTWVVTIFPRKILARYGTPAVFLFSAAIHELLLLIVVGQNYGLPSAFFLAQGALFAAEKRFFRARIEGSFTGWLWMIAALAGTSWLFFLSFYDLALEQVWMPLLRLMD